LKGGRTLPDGLEIIAAWMMNEASSYPLLFSREQIAAKVAELGAAISRDYAGQNVVLVGVLKGAAIFLADLARQINVTCTFDFVAVSSYRSSTKSSGAVQLIKDLDHSVEDRNIILVEDILDSGLTLKFLHRHFRGHKPRSLKVAALLDKPAGRKEHVDADYVGFPIENHFVVGYGMDYAEHFRNLPDIRILPASAVAKIDAEHHK
jgi:hypoxanthine phosphoribosyltransferase